MLSRTAARVGVFARLCVLSHAYSFLFVFAAGFASRFIIWATLANKLGVYKTGFLVKVRPIWLMARPSELFFFHRDSILPTTLSR